MKNFLPNLFPQQISKHSLIYFISGSLPLTHLYSQYRNLSLNLKQQTVLKVYKFPSIPSENKKSHSFGYFRIWFVFFMVRVVFNNLRRYYRMYAANLPSSIMFHLSFQQYFRNWEQILLFNDTHHRQQKSTC
jgi:hypothetical protein